MATPPTFTAGSVLTAAQMNAVGLWKITGGTYSGTLLSVSNCFTSDYSNYMIKLDNVYTPSGVRTIAMQLQNASPVTSLYFWAGYYSTFGGGFGSANSTTSGMAYWVPGTAGTYSPMQTQVDVYNPQKSVKTGVTVSGINFDAGYHMGGYQDTATSYNGFRIYNTSGDTCNFNWTLYGYR